MKTQEEIDTIYKAISEAQETGAFGTSDSGNSMVIGMMLVIEWLNSDGEFTDSKLLRYIKWADVAHEGKLKQDIADRLAISDN